MSVTDTDTLTTRRFALYKPSLLSRSGSLGLQGNMYDCESEYSLLMTWDADSMLPETHLDDCAIMLV